MSDPDLVTAAQEWVDAAPPTVRLAAELLAARHRLGEQQWTMDSDHRKPLKALREQGLAEYRSGVIEKTVLARLTPLGEAVMMDEGYDPPFVREAIREYAARERPTIKVENPEDILPFMREQLQRAWHEGFTRGEVSGSRETPINPHTENPYRKGADRG